MIAAHQTMLAPPALPYDAEVEYLESTGTQYVDTGIVPTDTTGFVVRAISMPTGEGNNRLIGCQDGQVRCLFSGSPKTTTNSFFGWNAAVGHLGNYSNSELVASLNFLNDRTAVLNGETKAAALETLGALTSSILIFGNNVNGAAFSSQLFSGRLIYAKVSDGSTLVRDYVPVRVGQVGYLFDKVSKQLFGNAGTGSFVLGPDK